jgi:hypothetical protein
MGRRRLSGEGIERKYIMAAEKSDRIKELTELLSRASKAYYAQDQEIMSNYEYDRLYDELEQLEREMWGMRRWTNFPRRLTRPPCFPWTRPKTGRNCVPGCRASLQY